MSSANGIALTVILALAGFGVTAGQTESGFTLNGWALFFWLAAVAVACWTWVVPWASERLRDNREVEPLDLEPPPPKPQPPEAEKQPPPVRLMHIFTHMEAGDAPAVPVADIERMFSSAGWEVVVQGPTSLKIHSDGVWVHGGTPSERRTTIELLRAHSIDARIDDRAADVPLQVIVGRAAKQLTQLSGNDLVPSEFLLENDTSGGHLWLKLTNQKSEPKEGFGIWLVGGRIYSTQHAEYRPYKPLAEMRHQIRLRRVTGTSGQMYWHEPRSYELIHLAGSGPWTVRGATEVKGATADVRLDDGRYELNCELRWANKAHVFTKEVVLRSLPNSKKEATFYAITP